MPHLETKRLFIASELPPSIRAYLETTQKELKKSEADVKWVEPQNIHLTLKFLGDVRPDKISKIISTLEDLFSQQKSFKAATGGLGCFPSKEKPRVLWAGLNDTTGLLKNTAAALEEALALLGFEKETRPFQAHITLGRVRSPRNGSALLKKIDTLNEHYKPTDLAIDNVTLFESRLSVQGSTYSVIHQIKFLENYSR